MGNSARKVHDYRLKERIGGGCFGTVYKAKSSEDTKVYVVKEVYRGKSAIALEMIHREAKVHEDLPYHRNIVRFIESFLHGYRMYIVLGYCSLGSLNDYVVRQPKLSLRTRLYIMFDLARGLQHLHRYNIVHRDIKPDNVLLSPGKIDIPTCLICDFGLARICGQNGQLGPEVDLPGSDDGPLLYMAPEIPSGTYTVSCDVFSLGLMYYILNSKQTMQQKGRTVLEPHINGFPFFMMSKHAIDVQIKLYLSVLSESELISSMLMTDPSERPNISKVLNQLQTIFSHALQEESPNH